MVFRKTPISDPLRTRVRRHSAYDCMTSILEARKKYYNDIRCWWSYCPPEYDDLKDLDPMEQIAGQVYYLARFFDKYTKEAKKYHTIKRRYRGFCENIGWTIGMIAQACKDLCGASVEIDDIPPKGFELRRYPDAAKDDFRRICDRNDWRFEGW